MKTFKVHLTTDTLTLTLHIQDHQNFLRLLTETENWLYEEGEDQAKQAYVDKLEELMVGPSLPLESTVF